MLGEIFVRFPYMKDVDVPDSKLNELVVYHASREAIGYKKIEPNIQHSDGEE